MVVMAEKVFSFLLFFGITFLVAYVGSTFMPGEWYALLDKPFWNPPNWIFGPIWTVLYVLIATSVWLVWLEKHPIGPRAITWWLIQLILNAGWSWVFFGLHQIGWALVEMSALLSMLSITIRYFKRIKPSAASLLTPYLIWVAFAWVLNLTIWWLNGGRTIIMNSLG
jgi:benzodiazapine receptor